MWWWKQWYGREILREGRVQKVWVTPRRLFYAVDGLVASTDLYWLQGGVDTQKGLFNRVVLLTNFVKTVSMVCLPYRAAVNQSDTAYKRRIKVERLT